MNKPEMILRVTDFFTQSRYSLKPRLYAEALNAHGVPYELHVFPKGAHGLAMADRAARPVNDTNGDYVSPYVARWAEMAAKWLEYTFFGECRV